MIVRHAHQTGFTLIEMMIVIVIIGILSTIIAGNFTTAKLKARDAQRKNDMAQLQRALETYYNDKGTYPPAAADGGLEGYTWGGVFADTNNTVYMNQLPSDDKQPTIQFLYETNTGSKKYHLFGYLENTRDEQIATYSGKLCGTKTCNYGVGSPNTTMTEVFQ